MNTSKDNILKHLSHPVFKLVGEVADEMNRECYVVGGYVRDIILERKSKDIDFVTVGSGIEVAKAVAQKIGHDKSHLAVYKTYGTAQVKIMGVELEFVGARRESYNRQSRNPIVEDGTLDDDQRRRDFTINAMAISVNRDSWGKLLDPFDGIGDMKRKLIRTPLDPDITFSDDPLRMMRAVRFATQLGFEIEPQTFFAIKHNAKRLNIITRERIADELMKIMRSPVPSRGFMLLDKSGLLPLVCPELANLKGVDTVNGRGHKDNFLHTMQVLDNVAKESDNVWLRWAALFHDIGKPATKHWDDKQGWTFHNHNFIGEKMVHRIFTKMRLPLNEHMKYVKKLVGLHMRPIALVEEEVTDSAVRRMLFEAGDDVDDLMILCRADITSKNQEKVKRFRENYELVKQKIIDIEEKDRVRNFQPPVDGQEIMNTFGLVPSPPVGEIKDSIKDAILDGVIRNNYAEAYRFMMLKAQELDITPVNDGQLNYVVVETRIGKLSIAASTHGIAAIEYGDADFSTLSKKMKLKLANRSTPLLANCAKQLQEYFEGERREFSLPLDLVGTEFQKKVWNTMLSIPYGTTISYKEESQRLGNEKAIRAVAQANGANPIPIIIPCHRVINSDGTLGGYSSGVDKKQFLLKLENSGGAV
ncbi:MAG: methylated-DNA--[Muribaculaceae bacterium]|nr:methylated-DNA--[protein]-cysteine S-methyltransferase [Muribaculaceae bacterium]